MSMTHPGRRAPIHLAAAVLLCGFALAGCQTAESHIAPAPPSRPGSTPLRPAAIDPAASADSAAAQLDRERAARGFEEGCLQYVLIEHSDWRVLCIDGGER